MDGLKNWFACIFFIITIIFCGCQTDKKGRNHFLNDVNLFQALIDSVVKNNDSVSGIILHIESPDLHISWTGISGVDKIGGNSKLRENQPFRIASITKTFVATAILLLYERKKLSLEDSIGKYIDKKHLAELIRDGYKTEKISIRTLLNHTSEIKPKEMSSIVHPYYNGKDFCNINPSIDLYGGGGLISAIFFKLLFENKEFAKSETLEIMLKKTQFLNDYKSPQDYRLGIQVGEIDGVKIFYHTGIWGTLAGYVPELKTSIAINFTNKYEPQIIIKTISIIKRIGKHKFNSWGKR
jgi:hypothetical protein